MCEDFAPLKLTTRKYLESPNGMHRDGTRLADYYHVFIHVKNLNRLIEYLKRERGGGGGGGEWGGRENERERGRGRGGEGERERGGGVGARPSKVGRGGLEEVREDRRKEISRLTAGSCL